MKNHKGQPLPKYRATKEVHALKIESVELGRTEQKATLNFVGGYHAPMDVGIDALAFGGIGEKPNHYMVWDDEGERPHIVPADRFEEHFKPVT